MNGPYYWDEALTEIFPDLDWASVTKEQWAEASDQLDGHVEQAREFMAPTPSAADIREMNYRPERESMREQIKALEARESAYVDHIKRGRHVYVEVWNGHVEVTAGLR